MANEERYLDAIVMVVNTFLFVWFMADFEDDIVRVKFLRFGRKEVRGMQLQLMVVGDVSYNGQTHDRIFCTLQTMNDSSIERTYVP